MWSTEFLRGNHRDDPLDHVADLAIYETNIFDVQSFIHNAFIDFQPTPSHLLVPTFAWHGIATTNYDLILERAYEADRKPVQNLVPLLRNGDRVDDKIKSRRGLMYLKLHGCITNIADAGIPLILTQEQYLSHMKGRSRLFDHLRAWAYEHPFLFVGHSLRDPDIRHFLNEFGSSVERPMFYAVTPNVSDSEIRLLGSRRITVIRSTFSDFMRSLDSQVLPGFRAVGASVDDPVVPHSISRHFRSSAVEVSPQVSDLLSTDVEYVHAAIRGVPITAQKFYRGFPHHWSAIEQGLDVRRHLGDSILTDVIVSPSPGEGPTRLHVIKGPAGSGKSVLLRRLAWDAATSFDKVCLFVRPRGRLALDPIREIHQLTGEPVFLFVDAAADHVVQLSQLFTAAKQARVPLTIVCAERHSEWNTACESLDQYVSVDYDLGYLSSQEIDQLLTLLERHRSLGTLEHVSPTERRAAFEMVAGRQILVALHEATLGKPFEDIIADEYSTIRPDRAQSMYLGICFLNRLRVPVRAGIIARVYGVRFDDFKESLFRPLEQIVEARQDRRTGDFTYEARHSHIAEIVYERFVSQQDEKLEFYLKFLSALNIDYDTDRIAFRRLVRGRSLLDDFVDESAIDSVYELADSVASDDRYVLQQRAIFEMNRSRPDFRASEALLRRATELAPNDRTIQHSLAEMYLKMAEVAQSDVSFDAYLKQSMKIAQSLSQSRDADSYDFNSLAKSNILRLRRLLHDSGGRFDELAIQSSILYAERAINEGLQRFPNDPYLLSVEAEVGSLIGDDERALQALERAFSADPRGAFIVNRLAKTLRRHSRFDRAREVLEEAVNASPNDRLIHFCYAQMLLDSGQADGVKIEHHLRRSFIQNDKNYEAQFWYARQLYVNDKIADSLEQFRRLGQVSLPIRLSHEIRGPVQLDGDVAMYSGSVARMEATYAWLSRDRTGDHVFFHRGNASQGVWSAMVIGRRVRFAIGFTFRGPSALDVTLEQTIVDRPGQG